MRRLCCRQILPGRQPQSLLSGVQLVAATIDLRARLLMQRWLLFTGDKHVVFQVSGWNVLPPGGLGNQPCPSNSSSAAGAVAAENCVCESGYWRGCALNTENKYVDTHGLDCTLDYASACVQCGPDDICVNDTLLHCPEFSSSPTGSSLPQHCICDDGYYAEYHDEH